MKIHPHSRPYFRKILTLTCVLVLSLCIALSVILYVNTNSAMDESVADFEKTRTDNLLDQVDIYLAQFVLKNTAFNSLNIPYDEVGEAADYWTRTVFDRMLFSHTNADAFTENIDITTNGKSIYPSSVPHERELGSFSVFSIYAPKQVAWPYYFDLEAVNRRGLNRVTITVSGYHLSKTVLSYRDKTREDYLLLPDGTVLLTNQKVAFMDNIENIYPGLLSHIQQCQDTLCAHEDSYCFLSSPDRYGFRVLSLVDQSVYSQQRKAEIIRLVLISSVMVCLAVTVSSVLSMIYYRPINNTVKLLKMYIPDNLHDYENEIVYINQNLSKYVAQGKKMEAALPQAMKRVQDAQTAMLQHQINSHFLFNTLENIKSISVEELGRDNDIEVSIILLNNIIRESVLQKNAIVKLEHELRLAESYLTLMQMRFANVRIEWNVETELLQCKVFKFSLQPVLENCFIHAFKNRTGRDNLIRIEAVAVGNDFIVRISDNGHTISADALDKVNQILNMGDDENNRTQHVGLRNVQNRIRAVFGPEYGIAITSTEAGTAVEVRYPITKE